MTGAFSTDPLVQQPSRVHSAVSRAFSYLIDATPEEAMFAIFGHWGRGKSFVARTIGNDRAGTHKTVFFSSWRYPHAPECWAFLYETLMNEVRKSGTFQFVSTVLRRNVIRSGIWPAIAADTSVFFVIIGLLGRLELYADVLRIVGSILGLSVLFLLARLWFSGWKIASQLRDAYASVPSHRDKLGLQETLGDDIRILVTAWIGAAEELKARLWQLAGILLTLCIALPLAYLLIRGAPILPWFSTAPGIAWVAWNILLIGVTLAALPRGRPKHVLLVLEDLDRCAPGAALHVIESVALLLDPALPNGCIQAMALIDEAVLDAEIREKFSNRPDTKFVHAHKEKLFTAYVRLPPLELRDFAGLTAIFLMRNDYDAAVARVNAAEKELSSSTSRVEQLRRQLHSLAQESGPPRALPRQVERVKRILPFRARLDPESRVEYETVTEYPPAPTEQEVKDWNTLQEQKIHASRITLIEAESNHKKVEANLSQAKERLRAIENEIHARMAEQAAEMAEQSDQPGYSKALETTEDERTHLRQRINALPHIKGYDWGPRSAHVANKKYLLLKTLWTSFHAEFAGEIESMPNQERLQLVDAFFDTMQTHLGDPLPNSSEVEAAPLPTEMRKMADYVV